ncbi:MULTISPECIES: cell envelope integrity protein TolA [Streptomyces]|uniref:cell envelope integrity protein TolA n=1 Tax=Streptomyces TaxID=1883 RepID=UPI00131C0429|nr:cell envelope integrity protein TolA [Streptomyces griseus]
MSDFVETVARRAGIEAGLAGEILARHGVRESGILPRPRQLLVKRLAFTGEKSGKSTGTVDFSWDLGPGLWGVTADNLRGKSSILEIIWWCLRGSDALQADVRHWIHHVRLDAQIDNEPFTVGVDTTGSQLTGTLTVGIQEHATQFAGEAEFASVMDAFMMDRLGLEFLRGWRKDATADTTDQATTGSADGQVVVTSWPAFSHALLCRNRESDALLGQTAGGGTMVSLLQMFVGLPWTATRRDANAALGLVQQSLRGQRRRAQQDLAARSASVQELRDQLAQARQAAAQAEAGPTIQEAAEAVERAGARLAELTTQHAHAVQQMHQSQQAEQELHETLVLDQSRLRDLRETAAAQRFFGALKPTCCPRCSTALDQLPHADLDEAHCRICGSAPTEVPVDPSAADELAASIQTLKEAHTAAKKSARQAAQAVTASEAGLAQARTDLAAAQTAMPSESSLRAHLEVARVEGALAERQAAERRAEQPDRKSPEESVLEAAAKEADKRAKKASDQLLGTLSAEICQLAIRLGMKELQAVKLLGNGTLQIAKGDSKTTFTAVTPGEHVRLRIATLLALLRVGKETGVGRHPGLLLLDSAGAQETIDVDLAEVLSQLKDICEETSGLQVITATAKRDLATTVIPADRLKAAGPGEPVW